MLLTFITAALVTVCPPIEKTAEPGVHWNKSDEPAVFAGAESGCKARGFDCVLEIHKFGDDQFGVKCAQKED